MKADKELPEAFTLDNILENFSTNDKARTFLEMWLWPDGPVCPRCNGRDPERVYRMTGKSTRPGLCNCKDCRRQFTVTVGTIFEDSHIPLRKWLVGWFLICSAKKGISSLQLQRTLDLGSYRTALFMTHRIRHALAVPEHAEKMKGIVQVDETYVGGYEKRSFEGDVLKTGHTNKTAVVSLIEVGTGKKRSLVMPHVTVKNLAEAIALNVAEDATIHTDEHKAYPKAVGKRAHRTVNHRAKEYARKDGIETVSTNHCESSFSLLKRGVMGAFHHVSRKHLHRYMAEFDFRWNTRKDSDGERTVAGLKQAKGKRLTYRMPGRKG